MTRYSRRFRICWDWNIRYLTILGIARKYGMTVTQVERELRHWKGFKP